MFLLDVIQMLPFNLSQTQDHIKGLIVLGV